MYQFFSVFNTLKEYKLYNLIRVSSLLIGFVTSAMLLFYVVSEFNYDRNVVAGGDVYRVNTQVSMGGNQFKTATGPAPLADLMVREFEEAVDSARVLADQEVIATFNNQKFEEKKFYFTQSSIFNLFTFEFLHGDPKTSLDSPNSIVLTESVATKYGDPQSVIGQTVTINERAYRITGVVKDGDQNAHFSPRAFLSISTLGTERDVVWASLNDHTYIKLAPGSSSELIEAALPEAHNKYSEEVYKRFNASVEFSLQNVKDIHFGEKLRYELDATKIGDISDIYLALFVIALIIVLASTNYAILSIAISMKRAKEIGIRKVLGADRAQIMSQNLLESLILVISILLVSAVLVYFCIPVFNAEFGTNISHQMLFEWQFGVSMLFIALVVGVVCAWYPAVYLANLEPIKALKNQQAEKGASFPLRSLLLVVQLSLVVFMVSCTWTIYQQFQFLKGSDLGFDHKNIATLSLGKEGKTSFEALKQDLLTVPGVVEVSSATAIAGGTGAVISNSFEIERENGGMDIRVTKNFVVDEKFDDVTGIKVLQGRFFDKSYSTNDKGIVVNEAFVNTMGWSEPIGKRMEKITNQNMDKLSFEVIGVIKDFHMSGFYEQIEPLAMTYGESNNYALVRVNDPDSIGFHANLKDVFDTHIKNKIFEAKYVEDNFYKQYIKEEQKGSVLFFFTLLAIIISAVGVFGITSYDIKQRAKELAIRRVLGASSKDLAVLLMNNMLKLVAVATVLSLPLAYLFMDGHLQKFAYHISINPIPFIVSGLAVLLITLVTMAWHIIAALTTNPIHALREE